MATTVSFSAPVARASVAKASASRAAKASVAGMGNTFSGLKAQNVCFGPKASGFAAVKASVKSTRRSASALQATSSMEVVETITGLAGTLEDEVFRTAGVMYAITLVGLAVGFVLLRVEAFSEDQP
eukprot:CAMPEP_0182852406 /NCGR_PEP_ID=MMETSP0034_2-20130328/143_1 /TAXON_ID=156128 /ORGANISM="Nephroselmis pyriformis, Strain CCMP717" /LENGTH=125 /DNA_ID=CAMNT_0024983111 /DNA_START=26 /DNA_END=403 /DNA_ORIENTATION=-